MYIVSKISRYGKLFEGTKQMYFSIKNEQLLKKYIKIQNKISGSINKKFDSETVYKGKNMRTK